tara:strand:- start:119 stop:3004 length:2886 start_codon:yes stop_codon:yes gene_type:complete
MATFLSKLFKPKWQSKHLETRKQAVELLDGLKTEEAKILLQLAESDPSHDVQQLALQKITDTDALISLHKKAKEELKNSLEKRLYELASSQSLSIFDLILDLDLLTDMIIKSNQAESFIRGLARIESATALLKIATQSRNAQIRQAAAELIESEKELHALFEHAKNKDKTVYQISKHKLAEIRAVAQKDSDDQEKITKLLKDIDNLSRTEALQHFDARLAHIKTQWADMSTLTSDQQNRDFSQFYAVCESKLESQVLSPVISPEIDETDNQEALDEIKATLSTIKDTLTRFQQQAAKTLEISALDALIKTQENRWIEATRETDVSKLQKNTYLDGMTQLRHYLKALHSLADREQEISALMASLNQTNDLTPNALEQLRKKLHTELMNIDWPTSFLMPELLLEAKNTLEISNEKKQALVEKQKHIEEQITLIINKMDAALEDKQIKLAIQHLKDIQANLSKLEAKQAGRFQQGLALRINQLNELKDWQGFANTPKQEELCLAMERLTETHIDPADKADKIKTMQQEWKNLGGTGNQELWNRFKTASDKAFEPCALFFAEQKQLKQNNLVKRQTLLAQVKEYTANIDWEQVSSKNPQSNWGTSDWKTADKISRQARQEWRDAFPIDFKATKSIQSEFNTIMDSLDLQLEAEKTYNLSLKQAIVDEAHTLSEVDDIESSIQAIKLLQEKWQKIGITHHKMDRKLWAQYRTYCDSIFAKKDQQRELERSELDVAIETANTKCATLEADLQELTSKSNDELKNLLSDYKKEAQLLVALPAKVHEKISQRFEGMGNTVKDELKRRDKQHELASWSELARKSALLKQVYRDNQQQPLSESQMANFEQAFTSTIELASDIENSLNELCSAFKEDRVDTDQVIDIDQARTICIACEIAAELESPEADKALRMQLQVGRLSEGLSSGTESLSKEAQLEKALTQWYLSLVTTDADLNTLETRIETAKNTLFG